MRFQRGEQEGKPLLLILLLLFFFIFLISNGFFTLWQWYYNKTHDTTHNTQNDTTPKQITANKIPQTIKDTIHTIVTFSKQPLSSQTHAHLKQ
jgi:flagellar basal body-associated protein FliL